MNRHHRVGRPGPLGNPYRPSAAERADRSLHLAPNGCVTKYRRWLWEQIQNPKSEAYQAIAELALHRRAKPECADHYHCPGCPDNDPHCHARVIERCVDWFNANQVYKAVSS